MTTLYIKTHNATGLKYFGKTNRDPYTYKGSGTYWKRHLKIHGNDVTTEIYAQIDEITETNLLTTTALKFSEEHDIVESTGWANLMVEDGLSGGNTFANKTKEEMNIISEKLKDTQSGENNGMYGKTHSLETKEKNAVSHRGNKASDETKQKMSNANKKRRNNSKSTITVFNELDKVEFVCNASNGDFKAKCLDLNLPFRTLQRSYWNNGDPIYQNIRNCNLPKLIKNNRMKYIGWYAIKTI